MPDKNPAEEEYLKSVDELYDFTKRFFDSMTTVKKILKPEVRAAMDPQDLIDLEILLMPYQKFQNFLVKSPNNLSHAERINEIDRQFKSELYNQNINTYLEVRGNQAALNAFMGRLRDKGFNENTRKLLNDELIKPVQTFNKLELHMKVMRKNFAELQGVPVAEVVEYTATMKEAKKANKTTLMPKTILMNKYKEADVKSLLKLEDILNLNTSKQVQSNEAKDVDLFKRSASERKKLHAELIKQYQQDTINTLTAQLAQISKPSDTKEEGALSHDQLLQNYMITFADVYVDERTQGLFGTKRSEYLERVMDPAFTELKLPIQSGKKREETIFEYAGASPAVRDKLVAYLYDRAMTEGVSGIADQTVFTNAIKAVLRMGNDAIKVWNELAIKNTQIIDNNVLLLPLNTIDKKGKITRLKESNIDELYKGSFAEMPKEMISRYQPSLLVNWAIQASLPGDMEEKQYKKFQTLITDLKRAEAGSDPADIHQVFMLAYFDTYITERTKTTFGSQPGKLQAFLESIATDNKKHADSDLFGTVPPHSAEAMNLALRAVALAVTDNPGESSEDKEALFINILKAVKRMGIEQEWNGQVVGLGHQGLVLDEKKELKESAINKLWDSVKDTLGGKSPHHLDKIGLLSHKESVSQGKRSPSPTSDEPRPHSPSSKK